jgi:glucuronate isomerase
MTNKTGCTFIGQYPPIKVDIMIQTERYLNGDPMLRAAAKTLYDSASHLPLVCPHGHVDPLLFSKGDYHFGNPVELLIQPDHYVLRILHSQGISYEQLGIPLKNGAQIEQDPRKIWQLFADHFFCYDATPIGLWIRDELANVFGIEEKLTGANAQAIYDIIQDQLLKTEFTPRQLYQRFNIAVLSTTDSPTDSLQQHREIAASNWPGHILPTFRADTVLHIDRSDWRQEIEKLALLSGITIDNFSSYIQAIENRRAWFKENGATATDLAVVTAETALLSQREMDTLFQKGLKGTITSVESQQFVAGLLVELARMSAEDGLVMQIHAGCFRNHDQALFENGGPDLGADFPIPVEFTRPLQPLLNRYGNHPNFHLILFSMDESTYARELAPLASYYPAVKLGPPWWFNDNLNGIQRFFEQAVDSGGLYNTVGFNDDTRALLSIPARHDLWRRASANWLAGLLVRHIITEDTAHEMMKALACGLAIKAYRLEKYVTV